ncbi:MAG: hypothetical protein KGP28_08645 [Bdellovibrionales bacterium]|nr:hypothetical protein [Bdellovibrionales bacterium]
MNLKVDSADLFPLLSSIEGTYEAAKIHSRQVDQLLGFQIDLVEKSIKDLSVPWSGLDPDVLQTPYTELRYMLSKISVAAGQKVVELGSGYSRLAHVMDAHLPEVTYEGVEVVPERAREAMRVIGLRGLANAKVMEGDLFQGGCFPEGDVYFLYDLSSRIEASIRVVEALQSQAKMRPIKVMARGLASRQWIEREAPWLSQVVKPAHYGNFSVYRSG